MSDTPRTDAVLMCMTYGVDHHSERYKAVIALARKLELELDAANAREQAMADGLAPIIAERDALKVALAAERDLSGGVCGRFAPSGTDDLCRWCLAPKSCHEDTRADLPPCDRTTA
jgi:hypothetical protein